MSARCGLIVRRRSVDGLSARPVRRSALDRIRDVNLLPPQPGFADRLVEKLPGLAHKRAAHRVLGISRTFANQHEAGFGVSLAENDVTSALRERATRARSRLRS